MGNFRTLDLAIEFYDRIGKIELKGHMRDQLDRAASSIALNLSEGNAKRTPKEKRRYYHTAYASSQECKTILKLVKNSDSEIAGLLDHLAASVFRLMNAEIRTLQYTDDC